MSVWTDPQVQERGRALRGKLASLRGRVRVFMTTEGLSLALMAILLVSLVSLTLDFVFRLSYITRLAQFAIFTSALGLWLYSRVYGRLVRELPDDELALAVERAYPELDCRLVSALQFLDLDPARHSSSSPQLMGATVEDAYQASQGLDFSVVMDWGKLGERLFQAAVVAGSTLLLVFASNLYTFLDLDSETRRSAVPVWFQRNILLQNIPWPKSTRLSVMIDGMGEDNIVALPAGSPLEIAVVASGEIPRQVVLSWEAVDEDLDEIARQLAVGQASFAKVGDNSFRHVFASIDTSIRLRIWGGDAEAGPITVNVVRRPYVKALQLSASFPAHTGLEPKTWQSGVGDLAVPEGSRILVSGASSKSLKRAWLKLSAPGEPEAGTWTLPAELKNTTDFEVALITSQTLVARLDVEDRDGLAIENPPRLSFRAVPDREPKVTIATRGIGNMITPQATLPLSLRATDDYQLTRGGLNFKTNNPDPKVEGQNLEDLIPLQAFKGVAEAELEYPWSIEPLGLIPGTFLSFWSDATDNDGLREPKSSRSQVLNVRVVSREELMNDMIRRQQEQRRAFEDLIRIEEEMLEELKATVPDKKVAFQRARTQLRVARRNSTIKKELEQILEEMGNNKILEDKDRVRLSKAIIEPLTELIDERLPQSRRSLEELGTTPEDGGLHEQVINELENIVTLMTYIKDQMIRLETLTELITRLEGIIRLWDDVMDNTKENLGKD